MFGVGFVFDMYLYAKVKNVLPSEGNLGFSLIFGRGFLSKQ